MGGGDVALRFMCTNIILDIGELSIQGTLNAVRHGVPYIENVLLDSPSFCYCQSTQ